MNPVSQINVGPGASPPDLASDHALAQLEEILGEKIAPAILQARAAFRCDLPQLLQTQRNQWVVYAGERQIGLGTSKTELHQECLRRGLGPDQFLILRIEPDTRG